MGTTVDAVHTALESRFPEALALTTALPSANEFVIFSKPELGRLTGADLDAVWDLFAASFEKYGVTVHQVKILTGPELDAAGAMQQHYGVINQISRLGRPALTEAAERALQDAYGDTLESATVLGGHQFLEQFPEFTPFALAMLFSNASVGRLGPGTYAAPVKIDGQTIIVLNGFHPRQLSFFTAEDTVCAFLHGSSETDWDVLRGELIGSTDPAKAGGGSIRGRLFTDPASFGLSSVNSNFNGVHMSAGPLEGLAELGRFYAEAKGQTEWGFARTLVAAGATETDVTELVENPDLEVDGERTTAFDATEGVNAGPAAELLVGAQRV
ncbi:MAG TPA: hypothetical protein VIT20_06990 [Propionibacteriaceae bacterium]